MRKYALTLVMAFAVSAMALAQTNPAAQPENKGSATAQTGGTGTTSGTSTMTGNTAQEQGSAAVEGKSTAERQVENQISSQIPGSDVRVSVQNGQAILTGTVPKDPDRQRAEQIVRAAAGTMPVVNRVTAAPASSASSATAGASAGAAGGTAGAMPATGATSTASNGAGAPGAMAAPANPPGGTSGTATEMAPMSGPPTLQSQIQLALRNQNLTGVNVNLAGDTVTLSGSAPTPAAKQRAEQVVSQYVGNRRLQDNVSVGGAPQQ